jgi:4-alpha-glucanotransferase
MNHLSHPEIQQSFEDAFGKQREAPPQTVEAIVNAIGQPPSGLERRVIVAHAGRAHVLGAEAELVLEDGTALRIDRSVPPDLPTGYHRLRYLSDDAEGTLIICPGACFLPEALRHWGWSAQLYSVRSSKSWGIGDLVDLGNLGRWAARDLGAGILLINPLSAALPTLPQQTSPYFPSSRQHRNLLYLRIEELPGSAALPQLEQLAIAGKRLNGTRRIDRDAVFRLKKDALEKLWVNFAGDERFDVFCREQGESLNQFAIFCALAEEHNSGWHSWPTQFRDSKSAGVAPWAAEHVNRIQFYSWIQWLIDEQLARAAREISLMQDLPIGVDPDGAEAWIWQDIFAEDFAVGSPPDKYNTQGQNWGFPPFIPWKLRAAGYAPFIQTVRGVLRHAGGLRIDHVMGLFRLFWIPKHADPNAGAYVRYPANDLLAILALESARAGAYIVGEDLGTVEEGARQQLAASGVLSYRLLYFEKACPAEYPRPALAAVTTHDLPTIAGLWTGEDLRTQRELGLKPNEQGTKEIHEWLKSLTGLADETRITEVIRRLYELLAQAPSMVLTVTLEDLLQVVERPNMPGAPQHSWSLALPKTLEEIALNPLAREIADILRRDIRETAGNNRTDDPATD